MRVHCWIIGATLVIACGNVSQQTAATGGTTSFGSGGTQPSVGGSRGGVPSAQGGGSGVMLAGAGGADGGAAGHGGNDPGGDAGAGAAGSGGALQCGARVVGTAPFGTERPSPQWTGGSESPPRSLFDDASSDWGAGGEGGGGGHDVPLPQGSWDTQVILKRRDGNAPVGCSATHFTAHFEPEASGVGVQLSRDGVVISSRVTWDEASAQYGASGWLLPSQTDCRANMSTGQFALRTADVDSDGKPDRIWASGLAFASWSLPFDEGHLQTNTYDFSLRGVPDTRAPALRVPVQMNPLDLVTLQASEAVVSTSTVALVLGGTRLPLVGSSNAGREGPFTSFSGSFVLPFGSTWQVDAAGENLAGIPFAATPPVTVVSDPGLFNPDGFESEPNALLEYGAARVNTIVDGVSAISGCWSLWVPPGGVATLHLARGTGKNAVRFRARMLGEPSDFSNYARELPVQAAVIGGTHVNVPTTRADAAATSVGGGRWITPPQEFVIPLSESGDDVVVRIRPRTCYPTECTAVATVIDDLRIE